MTTRTTYACSMLNGAAAGPGREFFLSEAHRKTLRRLIESVGETEAIKMLDSVRPTISRALAVLPMRRGTVLDLSQRLESDDITRALGA
jgi:hypothetical protein